MYPVISTIALFFIFFQIQDPIQSRTVHCILMWMSSLLPSFDLEQFHKPFFFFFLLWHWHFWRLQASCCVRYFGLGLFNSLFMIQLKLIVLAKNNSEVMLCPRRITSRGTCCQFISFFADWVKVCVCACVCVCVRACMRVCVLDLNRLFVTPWTATRQAPLSMEFSGKNTGMDCHVLLRDLRDLPGIFLTQGLNLHLLCLLYWQVYSLPLRHLGSPWVKVESARFLHCKDFFPSF